MTTHLKRHVRVARHRNLAFAMVAGAALWLAVPDTALASAAAASNPHAVVAHHNGGTDPQKVEISRSIVSLGSGTIVVADNYGFWRTIVLGTSTTYTEGPMKVAPAVSATDLAVGSEISVEGSVDLNHTSLNASQVRIELSTVRGTIQSISPSAIMVNGPQPLLMRTVDLNAQTVVFSHAGVVALSTLSQGSFVEAFGIVQPDGSLLALYLGVDPQRHGFDHDSDFGFNLPNRSGPNHYTGRGSKG